MTPREPAATGRRVAVLKPDFGSTGGFERHLDGLLGELATRGWHFELISIPVERSYRSYGLLLDEPIRDRHDEYFLWAALAERVQRLDLSEYDAVLTTQPPTYLANHPRKLPLFYHHPPQFYDQAAVFADSGFVDPVIHAAAVAAVRSVEAGVPATVGHWLAGSHEVAQRLRDFWQVPDDRISIHSAPATSIPDTVTHYDANGPALVVGRLEWPKRHELAVTAAWIHPHSWRLDIVGSGSRLAFTQRLDAALRDDPALASSIGDDDLWRNTGGPERFADADGADTTSPVRFLGSVDDVELAAAYARSSVVITPTFREDYGLTVLEAMAHARPVIVCTDGGGLTEFVEHGVSGLIVEPTAASIADAVAQLRRDPDAAAAMGAAGRAAAAGVTWDRAVESVAEGLRRVMSSEPPAGPAL